MKYWQIVLDIISFSFFKQIKDSNTLNELHLGNISDLFEEVEITRVNQI